MRLGLELQYLGSGPLWRSLRDLTINSNSPVAADILFQTYGIKIAVITWPINGGVCPFRRTVILDGIIMDSMEMRHQAVVAHELVHVLERDLGPDLIFPSGSIRPSLSRRWIGDSTNYMEVIAYIAHFAIKYDSTSAEHVKAMYREDLLALTYDNWEAVEYIVDLFPKNNIYRANLERDIDQGRVPAEPWYEWFLRLGFRYSTIHHIFDILDGAV